MDLEKKDIADPEETKGDESAGTLSGGPQEFEADPKWVASTLSLPREVFFVAIVCMAQFCTRELRSLEDE